MPLKSSDGSIFQVQLPRVYFYSRVNTTDILARFGTEHLQPDSIDPSVDVTNAQVNYGQGIVDEAMQWNKDRESSSVDSSSDSGLNSGDSSNRPPRGLDPTTLYFKKEDVIMLVDGE